eukprot:13154664-Alexandrium_andersonii.AAC.1
MARLHCLVSTRAGHRLVVAGLGRGVSRPQRRDAKHGNAAVLAGLSRARQQQRRARMADLEDCGLEPSS